jgi:uncharacterized CHY-type Zn-finger protein
MWYVLPHAALLPPFPSIFPLYISPPISPPPLTSHPLKNSKHILNAQVSIRSPCCRKWFDCAACHAETESHPLQQTTEMTFVCKKCRKAFRKDMSTWEDADEFCPNCDNHFVIEAKEPKAALKVEGEDARVDNRMLRDERVRNMMREEGYDPWEDVGGETKLG